MTMVLAFVWLVSVVLLIYLTEQACLVIPVFILGWIVILARSIEIYQRRNKAETDKDMP
jgi:hypothetical protein